MKTFSSKREREIERIAVIHLNQIGDLIFSLPFLKALRKRFPGATIHSILRPPLRELLAHSPDVDEVIPRKTGIGSALRLLKKIRRNRYDLLISLSRSLACLFLATFSGARSKMGFRNFPWDFCLDVKEEVKGHPSWHNNLNLLERLEIKPRKKDYVGLLTLPPEEKGRRDSPLAELRGPYAVISPGTSARRGAKAWEEGKFGELIALLKEKYQFDSVVVGDEKEREANERIIEASSKTGNRGLEAGINLAWKTDLKALCYLLKRASLFVGVDSGIMHLASSFDIPVIGIFGPTDPDLVGPQNPRSVVVRRQDLDCVPCYLKGCEDRACLTTLEVQTVFEACAQVLGMTRPTRG